jgi:hypothetical protein
MYMSRPVIDPEKESLYHIAGGVSDPSGIEPDLHGYQSSIQLNRSALAHPLIRWRDRVIEADLYEMNGLLVLHIICPRCSTPEVPHALWVRQGQKDMLWRPEINELSVAVFECTWELPEGRRQEFGLGLCRWRVAIEKNFARDV